MVQTRAQKKRLESAKQKPYYRQVLAQARMRRYNRIMPRVEHAEQVLNGRVAVDKDIMRWHMHYNRPHLYAGTLAHLRTALHQRRLVKAHKREGMNKINQAMIDLMTCMH